MVGCHTSQHSATTKAKQAVIVENRPGAGGNIATVLVARSPADGYTLLLLASSLVVNPSLFKQGNYDQLQVLSLSACICYQKPLAFKSVNAKHRKTLQAIFAHPTSATVVFSHIEALVVALGGAIKEREGSRIKITLHNAQWHCHRPHPGKEAKRYQVEEARELLERLGIKP